MAEAAALIDNKQTAIFELQVKNLRQHVDVHERMNDTKFDKIEALMARNLAKQEELIGEIRSEVKEVRSEVRELRSEFKNMDARMSRMEQRLDGLQEDMSEVKGDIKAINANFNTLQNKFAWNLAWVVIIMALALALAQYFGK